MLVSATVGGDVSTVGQDRRAVAQAENLVHAVRNVDDAAALGAEAPSRLEEQRRFALRQRRRWLAEMMTRHRIEMARAMATIWRRAVEAGRRRHPRQSRLPQRKGGAEGDPGCRSPPHVLAEILRPQPHRAGLRQAQDLAPKGRGEVTKPCEILAQYPPAECAGYLKNVDTRKPKNGYSSAAPPPGSARIAGDKWRIQPNQTPGSPLRPRDPATDSRS